MPMANPGDQPLAEATPATEGAPATFSGMRKIAPRRDLGAASRIKGRRGTSVRVLKVALPLIMCVTLGYVGYWWLESRGTVVDPTLIQKVPGVATTKAEVTIQDVKYDGKDDKGRPFSITADSASHVDGDDRHINLRKPIADIVLASGAYAALTANEGLLDRDADVVTLNGDVTLSHDNGLSFQTQSATIDLDAKTAEGHDQVEGQNGDWELTSQGFRVLDDGDTIQFTGKAFMKIHPKKDRGG